MAYTENLTQALAIAADGIHAASQSTSEKLTSAIDMQKFNRVFFLIDSGTLGTSATLDFSIKGATTSGGTYTTITGTAITQLVKASNDNNYVLVEISSEQVIAANANYRYIKGSLTPGTAACTSAVVAFGSLARFEPASTKYNPAAVAQVLALT